MFRNLGAIALRITLIAVGKLKSGPERQLAERYRERAAKAGRALGFRSIDIIEIDESRARDTDRRMLEEAIAIAHVTPEHARLAVLDERGDILSSKGFSELLARWRDEGLDCTFVIGGADGLSPSVRDKAHKRLAFGAFTWPHQLVRIMLLEQLYRATTILAGHPYHRE